MRNHPQQMRSPIGRKLTRSCFFGVVLAFVAIMIVLTGEASVPPPPVFLPPVIYETGGLSTRFRHR